MDPTNLQLVLSLFPGIGVLDRGFEDEGFVIVRGPDLLWGGNIKRFHVPPGRFAGVIGGSPCQAFTAMLPLIKHHGLKVAENLNPEFERVVDEAQPDWFVMENIERAPLPSVHGYQVDPTLLDNRWLGNVQSRRHRFSFGTRDGRKLHYDTQALEHPEWQSRVCRHVVRLAGDKSERHKMRSASKERSIAEMCELQGLPADFFEHAPFTRAAMRKMLGNAVAYPMARSLARAVREALSQREKAA